VKGARPASAKGAAAKGAARHAPEAAGQSGAAGQPGAAGRAVAKIAAPGSATAPDGDLAHRVFTPRAHHAQTRISTRAIEPPAVPSSLGAAFLVRSWRCPEADCPSFGEHRRPGQPVPRLLKGVPVCPRHARPLKDDGPRPAEYPVAVVIDDVVRRRFPVTAARAVHVGRRTDDPDDVTLELWLHEAAADWIAERHAKLEIVEGTLTVTDLGENGTVIWRRSGPGVAGESLRLFESQSYRLDAHDSVELYTGVELVPGNRRVVGGPVTASDVRSVLADAPTVALRARQGR
jgi:hypothetical protein